MRIGSYIRRKRKQTDFRFKLGAAAVLAFALLFTGARLLLFTLNYSTFSALPFTDILWGFLQGIRFDAATIALFALPFIWLMILPVKSKKWIKFWTVFIVFEFILAAAVLAADMIYFGYVKRHMGEELLSLANDITFIIGYAFGPGLKILIPLLFALFVLVWAISAFIDRHYNEPSFKLSKEGPVYAVILALILICVYGKPAKYPLNIPDAYYSVQNSNVANLALNGIFTSYQVIMQGNYIDENDTDINLATDTTAKHLLNDKQIVNKPYQFPLMRSDDNAKPEGRKPNIVIIAMESWVPQYIDEVNGSSYGVTPVFDGLIKNGMYFDNFYAFELRSIHGIAAVLTGVPALPKLPKLGYGLEEKGITKLADILDKQGYNTIFAQTSERKSFNLCNTAYKLGFKESYGMEDMPQQFPYVKQDGYGYDYDMYALLTQKVKDFNKTKQPFFIFAFTGITHMPYLGNLAGFDKYPNDTEQHKYLNSLNYADYSIGYLLEQAKKDGWFDNTIFIFVADHTFNRQGSIKEKYNIPMLIYGPKFINPQRVKETASQLDILPTVIDLLKLNAPYSAAGSTLLERRADRAAIFADGYTIGLITDKGAMRHTRAKALEDEAYTRDFDKQETEKMLLALDKTYYTLIKEGRWYERED